MELSNALPVQESRCRGCKRRWAVPAALGLAVASFGGIFYHHYFGFQFQETRPDCEPDEDPNLRDCRPKVAKIDWKDPSFASVDAAETIVELRWFKGKLYHPIGRFFGGHHSALVAVFKNGKQMRIEKFGVGSVQYCPTRDDSKCNLRPGEIYKTAGGRFLKNITWRQLHAAMIEDFNHYDTVDANCHHAVQHAWNAAVVPRAQDRGPAPDTNIATRYEGFLRWWQIEERDTHWQAPEEVPENSENARSLADTNVSAEETVAPTSAPVSGQTASVLGDPGPGATFTTYGQVIQGFDGHKSRRRRRRQVVAQRCRGSKLDADDNCPHRESCYIEESSNPTCKCESECSSKCRLHMSAKKSIMKDKDFTGCKSQGQSDCSFQRAISSGMEFDYSGCCHMRSQISRPSSQSESCEDSSMEMQPMDINRVRSNSKDEDASSVSASECSHSQDGRSKADVGEGPGCNTGLGGVTLEGGDYLCQWKCNVGEVQFATASKSSYECTGDKEIELSPGQSESDCLISCAATGCGDDCTSKCRYLAAAALDAGQAVCFDSNSSGFTSTGYQLTPVELNTLSGGDIVGIICGILVWCCCCCCYGYTKSRQS